MIRRSRFIGSAKRVQTSQEARAFIAERSSLHSKANHNCWGYKVTQGAQNNTVEVFSSDDGEPSGTAGKPIIGAIEKAKITNTTIVVSRYFGGHKLGIRGLIDAYSQAAHLAIESSGHYAYCLFEEIDITCGYSEWPRLQYEFEKHNIAVKQSAICFTDKVSLKIMVASDSLVGFVNVLKTYQANHLEIEYRLTQNNLYRPIKKLAK